MRRNRSPKGETGRCSRQGKIMCKALIMTFGNRNATHGVGPKEEEGERERRMQIQVKK